MREKLKKLGRAIKSFAKKAVLKVKDLFKSLDDYWQAHKEELITTGIVIGAVAFIRKVSNSYVNANKLYEQVFTITSASGRPINISAI